MYDDRFSEQNLSAADVMQASFQLLGSGIWHGVGDLFRRRRGMLGGVSKKVRWTAGMVVQWRENEALRKQLTKDFEDAVRDFDDGPHAILAHSLGSLVTYDALLRDRQRTASAASSKAVKKLRERLAKAHYVVFGSQIGNPFVRGAYGGRLQPLPNVRRWTHLYNRHDDILTARIGVRHDTFEEVDTFFDLKGMGDHDAEAYIAHDEARDTVWTDIAQARNATRVFRVSDRAFAQATARRNSDRRALLVGINDYPDESMRLAGCVNDVYLMSSVLQESGFAPENIRVVLNDRATADGIRDRLGWLLEGVRGEDDDPEAAGDQRVFYFSGHGAQIAGYGIGEAIDRKDECLVPYDFDWSLERAVIDDELYELYSQLPYSSKLMLIFDCCHSGGLTRDGSAKIRGVNPPDDIRHRTLEWNEKEQMWDERKLVESRNDGLQDALQSVVGTEANVLRKIGHARSLRASEEKAQKKAAKNWGHLGPFMPVIYQACSETEFAYEYRHGVESYGAFTYSLALELRKARAAGTNPTFRGLVDIVRAKLGDLGYRQTPQTAGPDAVLDAPIPLGRGGAGKGTRKKRKKRKSKGKGKRS